MTPDLGRAVVVDPDRVARRHLRDLLVAEGYQVSEFSDAAGCLAEVEREPVQLVLTELDLAGVPGAALCAELRRQPALAVVVVSASGSEADTLAALEHGADDVVRKPYSDRELLLRLAAVRRRRRVTRTQDTSLRTTAGLLELDPLGRAAYLDGRWVLLSAPQYRLLEALVRASGRVLTREQLLTTLRRPVRDGADRILDGHIRKLRVKLEPDPHMPALIVTVRALGYRLVLAAAS